MQACALHRLEVENSAPESAHLIDHSSCVLLFARFTDLVECILDAEHLPKHILNEARLKVFHILELSQVLAPHEGGDLWDEVTIIDGSRQILHNLSIDQEHSLFCALFRMFGPIYFIFIAKVADD